MNDLVVKPFPCKEVDCGMSFFTEDHLSVHIQAKHTKLNLEIPKTSNAQIYCKLKIEKLILKVIRTWKLFLADQTPTPTRLLNNCEELRVFDDLQNINPFEEGFRRACEDSNNGLDHSGYLSVPSNQDTLHTPQILSSLDPSPIFDETATTNNIPKVTTTRPSPDRITILDEKIPTTIQAPIALLPKPSIIYATPIKIKTESKSSESVKDRLKSVILSNSNDTNRLKTQNIPTIIIGTVPIVATPANLILNNVVDDKKSETRRNDNEISRKRSRSSGESNRGGSQKTERNRAAAKRYRWVKKLIDDLKKV
jgi:hypothetical protein